MKLETPSSTPIHSIWVDNLLSHSPLLLSHLVSALSYSSHASPNPIVSSVSQSSHFASASKTEGKILCRSSPSLDIGRLFQPVGSVLDIGISLEQAPMDTRLTLNMNRSPYY